jgi:DNA mismatch endonuclease Vsr
MARVRQSGTDIETIVADNLRALGLRYRRNVKTLVGSPDFANQTHRWASFVNGCFWHNHTGCRSATIPKSNEAFWFAKFRENKRRDARAVRHLRRDGYRVIVIWGCERRNIPKKLSQIFEPRRVKPR